MIDFFFGLVATWGLFVIAASAYFSCLAVPVPTFAVMLAGGGFAAAGDLVLWQVLAVAYVAALCGDQTGFQLGRLGGRWLDARLVTRPNRAALFARAQTVVDRWGSIGVFFSTWAAAPLGPWVNFAAGAARLHPLRFFVWDALGEAIWVTGYVMLGYYFAANLDALTILVSDWAWLLTALSLVIAAGFFLLRQSR
ncbi:membrane protein DedA, SNARE-associated domain [Yoonia tamlensis]|uniref:Membrane protein DedA, SNARE-associated domain n=1 Tax=Yoonia tamlensis TaxID=390270 RepID=A0A1I6FPE2_9RHOB|nr:VTT domain-containing protein [Yoonia tamlensis]SFR31811.1 membrane protein DedA, SNARE-associated domain [Yoonia tamlensis]